MRKRFMLLLALAICFAGAALADVSYTVTVDTSSLAGTTGSIDMSFIPGPLPAQQATLQVRNFASDGNPAGKCPCSLGKATGQLPGPLGFDNGTFSVNDYFQSFTFGKTISFQLNFGGPAVNAPDNSSTAGTSFTFALFRDAAGTIPAPLIADSKTGAVLRLDINLGGIIVVKNFSSNAATAGAGLSVAAATGGQVVPFAPDTIVSAYGANLATGLPSGNPPPDTTWNGTTVRVVDSNGKSYAALIYYAAPAQVNWEIPDGIATGAATVTITNANGAASTAAIQIGTLSPGLFQLDADGLIAAWVLPVTGGTQQPLQPVYQLNSSNALIPLPVNAGSSTTQYYLEMYGSGLRSAKNVTVTVGGVNVPVLFWGAAPGFPGEDQVNIGPLPASLAGAGNVKIVLSADGQQANSVNVSVQ